MPLTSVHPLVGSLQSQEGWLSDVRYTISCESGVFSVSALDAYDNEVGQVYDVKWDEKANSLLFCCYWESSGRFSKCKLSAMPNGKADFIYQYTDHEILVRSNVA